MTTKAKDETRPGPDWLSCTGAAARVGLTPSRVAQLRREGRIRAIPTALGFLYDPEDLQRFINERTTTR